MPTLTAFENLNTACMAFYAEAFTLKSGTSTVLLTGMFGDHIDNNTLGHAGFSDRLYSLKLMESTMTANNIAPQMTVIARGIEFQIIDLQTDTAGMTELILRRFK